MAFLATLLFIFGLFFGSFFLVIVDRTAQQRSPLRGRSKCDACGHELAWYDLIPLLSFLSTGAKCRYCKHELSYYYPIVELVTGTLFAITGVLFAQNSTEALGSGLYYLQLIFHLITVSTFIIIFFSDLKYGIIPFVVVIPVAVLTLIYTFVTQPTDAFIHFLSAVGAGVAFYLLHRLTRGKGMGFGDVVLVAYLGLLLGFPGIGLTVYLAFLTGAAVSLILILTGRKHLKGGTVPFGPFLIVSAFIVLFWEARLISFIASFITL